MTKTTIELMEEALNNLYSAEKVVIDNLANGEICYAGGEELRRAWEDVNGLMEQVQKLAARRQALKNARKSDIKS
jgi:hypothetical protein